MAIGERIHYFRSLRGMTQKYLGQVVGFPEKSADIRMAQYESGTRTPKAELTSILAAALGVCPHALDVPDIDSYVGLMHTLFALEDIYGVTIDETDGEVCLRVDKSKGKNAVEFHKMLCTWRQAAARVESGEISKEQYDRWRYHYPEYDATQHWEKVPSQALSDMLVDALTEEQE